MRAPIAIIIALLLGSSCDDEPPPRECTEWLVCMSECRAELHRNGIAADLDSMQAFSLCDEDCPDGPVFTLNLREFEDPMDSQDFWTSLNRCIDEY
jgi:hypothetical protein